MRARHVLFAAVPSLIGVAIVLAAWYRLEPAKTPEAKGKDLNQRAWEASFTERGLPIAPGGPRDGYWSSRLTNKHQHPTMGFIEDPQQIPGILDIDASGCQTWRSTAEPAKSILILGGSVGFGAYASTIHDAYFATLGRTLEADGLPTTIKVHGAGGWKARNEVPALDAQSESFDLVVFVNGANDLVVSHGGDDYDATDIVGRTQSYLSYMRRAAEICKERHVPMLVVLQPFLLDRDNPTPLEAELKRASLTGGASYLQPLRQGYETLRTGLRAMESSGEIQFYDASRLFNDQAATTFTDLWHFADPGHAIFGRALAAKVETLLRR
jgi:hypothetical protein